MTPPPAEADGPRLVLPLLLLLALALRLFQLGTGYFWMDEIATVFFIRLSWEELFGPIARLEPNPPGYYALLKVLRPLLGEGEWGLRLPSALAGAAAVLPVFLFTRRAFGPRAALVAGLLLAVAGQHVMQSQEARNYATLFLLAAIALASLEAGLETPGRRGLALLLAQGPLWAVMLYLHATSAFAVLGLGSYALARILPRRAWAKLGTLAIAGLVALLLCLPWLGIMLELSRQPTVALTWIPPLTAFWAWASLTHALAAPVLEAGWVATATCAALLPLGVAACLAWRRRDGRAGALLLALAAGVGLMVAASLFRPVLLDRTALVLLVFALPLYGYAATAPRLGALLLLPLALLTLGGLLTHYREDAAHGRRWQPWGRAIVAIEPRIAPGERLVIAGTFELLAPVLYGGERLAASRPAWAVVPPGDRLARRVIARIPGAAILDTEGPCPGPEAARGAWVLGFAPAGESRPIRFLEACGWALEASEERFAALRLRRLRAPP
ncbi:glycosyltransferase family 39 protein [Sabulicella rubraurantiaca]|uniref:glycosyltransferase family 39 protein n=1 Tax=Sabulicella rubraurantiaca TaxID=2811429 RepID=UPI001A978562|nr:glycosyltransferase family 39 protein [Sabulicella rubraurantiaca]